MASGSKKVIYASLAGNTAIAVTKFIATSITGSSAMLSEGVHSLVDVGNQVLLLHGLRRAQAPASAAFPFGHGKEIYFWSFVVAILIFAVGAGVSIYEGIHQISDPHPITDPTVNYVVLGLAIVFEGAAFWFAAREFATVRGDQGAFAAVRSGKDPTMFVVLFEDAAALLGLFVALIGIAVGQLTGLAWLDGASAVVIGLILAATAVWLAYETKSLLIGESATAPIVESIRSIASSPSHVLRVNEVLTMHMGPEFILANLSIEFHDDESTESLEVSIARIDREIKAAHPRVKRVFIKAETVTVTRATETPEEPRDSSFSDQDE